MAIRARGRAFAPPERVPRNPNEPPFASFLERERTRAERSRRTRRVVILSVVFHVLVFGGLIAWNYWDVEELFGRSVEVKFKNPPKPTRPAPQATAPSK